MSLHFTSHMDLIILTLYELRPTELVIHAGRNHSCLAWTTRL